MIPIGIRQLTALLSCVLILPASPETSAGNALLAVGSFHGGEVQLKQPRQWLGLFCSGHVCNAHQTIVSTAAVHDDIVDEDSKASTGVEVSIAESGSPIFLVRGLAFAKRQVPTVFSGEQALGAGDSFSIDAPFSSHLLKVEGKKSEDEALPKGSRLLFSQGTTSQELLALPDGGNDPYITVLWIGDIDGDGKPDLYLNTSWHYNVSHKVLWLSSLARAGQLVGQAAVLHTTGC